MDHRKQQLKNISDIEKAVSQFDTAIRAAIFDANKAREKADSRDYSDFTAEAAARLANQERQRITATLKNEIELSRQTLSFEVSHSLQQMRDDFIDQATALPTKKTVLDALQVYKTFGIPISRADVQALAIEADGNLLALRAIQSVAASSGLKIRIPSYQNSLDILESLEKSTLKAGLDDFITFPEYTAAEGGAVEAQKHIAFFTSALAQLDELKKTIETQGVSIDEDDEEEEEAAKNRKAREAAAAALEIDPDDEAEAIALRIAKESTAQRETMNAFLKGAV